MIDGSAWWTIGVLTSAYAIPRGCIAVRDKARERRQATSSRYMPFTDAAIRADCNRYRNIGNQIELEIPNPCHAMREIKMTQHRVSQQ